MFDLCTCFFCVCSLFLRDPGMAFLDQTGGSGHRLHGWTGVHVRPVQSLHPSMEETQGLQPGHIRPEPARHV